MTHRSFRSRYAPFTVAVLMTAGFLVGGCRSESEAPGASVSGSTESPGSVGERPDPAVPQGAELERPEGWIVRLDKPDPDVVIGSADTADIFFVNMTPGWHITTHKSAIFYHPASTAEGAYTAHASIYFSDPGERQREGYGIFFGGTDLDSDAQSYTYFLLRNTGEFLIKRREGSETSIIQDWTRSDAVRTVPTGAGGSESVLNELAVRVEGGQVHFILNGENVGTHPASSIPSDGTVGLRLNHGTNVHVSDLGVEPSESSS